MSEPSLMQVESSEKPCPNTECETHDPESTVYGALVEPEVDGDHRYWECEECGYAFGYERIETGTRVEGNCAIGVPESVRKGASKGMETAIKQEQRAQPVPITIGRRPNL